MSINIICIICFSRPNHSPVENLDSHLVPGQLVEADLDFAECPDAQGLPKDVVTDLDLGRGGSAITPLSALTDVPHLVTVICKYLISEH